MKDWLTAVASVVTIFLSVLAVVTLVTGWLALISWLILSGHYIWTIGILMVTLSGMITALIIWSSY